MVQIHYFRLGRPHTLPEVVATDHFPVSGLIVVPSDTPQPDEYIRAHAPALADYILSCIADALTPSYIKPLAMLMPNLSDDDRQRAGRAHTIALPDPSLQHTNPAAMCPACTAGFLLEHNDDLGALSTHIQMVQGYAATYVGRSYTPEDLDQLERVLNSQLHGIEL